MYVFVKVYMHDPDVSGHIHVYMYACEDPRLALGVFLNHAIPYSSRVSSLTPELADKATWLFALGNPVFCLLSSRITCGLPHLGFSVGLGSLFSAPHTCRARVFIPEPSPALESQFS